MLVEIEVEDDIVNSTAGSRNIAYAVESCYGGRVHLSKFNRACRAPLSHLCLITWMFLNGLLLFPNVKATIKFEEVIKFCFEGNTMNSIGGSRDLIWAIEPYYSDRVQTVETFCRVVVVCYHIFA